MRLGHNQRCLPLNCDLGYLEARAIPLKVHLWTREAELLLHLSDIRIYGIYPQTSAYPVSDRGLTVSPFSKLCPPPPQNYTLQCHFPLTRTVMNNRQKKVGDLVSTGHSWWDDSRGLWGQWSVRMHLTPESIFRCLFSQSNRPRYHGGQLSM